METKTFKEDLLEKMKYFSNTKEVGVRLEVGIKDYPEPEHIIVANENLLKKVKYIKETYDDNLKHKYSDGVRIYHYETYIPEYSWEKYYFLKEFLTDPDLKKYINQEKIAEKLQKEIGILKEAGQIVSKEKSKQVK